MKTMRGFTLLELLLVIAIFGTLAAIAIPNIRDLNAGNRQLTTANLFVATFHQARSEAITRATNVDVTANDDADGNQTWQAGWTITVTEGGVTTTIASIEALPAELILTGEPDTTIPSTPAEEPASVPPLSFRFNSQGRLDVDGNITLCDKRTGESGRWIQLRRIGSARVAPTLVNCE